MLDKNNPEWTMWTDIFQWRKKWYQPKNEKELEQATEEGIAFGEKYKGFGTDLILVSIDQMSKEYRERNE